MRCVGECEAQRGLESSTTYVVQRHPGGGGTVATGWQKIADKEIH